MNPRTSRLLFTLALNARLRTWTRRVAWVNVGLLVVRIAAPFGVWVWVGGWRW